MQSFFGSDVDWNHANQTRPILDALNKLADATGAAFLPVRHGTKATVGLLTSKGLEALTMTKRRAFSSSTCWRVMPDDDKSCALIHVKTPTSGRKFYILGYAIDLLGRFAWTGESISPPLTF